MRFLVKLGLSALAFVWILPLIDGIHFRGNVLIAIALAFLFGIMLWIVDFAAVAFSALLTISSLGLALLWLIPLWVLGFWLLPAVALKMVSDFFPSYLSISGWTPAILGGLIMLLIGMVTTNMPERTAQFRELAPNE
jgi:uncharacterized membrane protein YvlD (DUF360 family)